jgi:uncharacterized membrane protein YphA (DoxX/SURF4 family)
VIFVSEGLQKFLYPEELGSGRFTKIGVPIPEILAPSVGAVEIVCGSLLLFGVLMRYALMPLLVTMLVAIVSTKLPILLGHDVLGFTLRPLPRYGLLSILHEARTDICMVCGLMYLWIVTRRGSSHPL